MQDLVLLGRRIFAKNRPYIGAQVLVLEGIILPIDETPYDNHIEEVTGAIEGTYE